MSTVNVPLLRKAVEWAEAEAAKPPELCEWEQRLYVLPTVETASADLIAEFGGLERLAEERQRHGRSEDCGTCYCVAGYVASLSGQEFGYHEADVIAAEALGLDGYEASSLFDARNTIEDVRRIAEEIARERL